MFRTLLLFLLLSTLPLAAENSMTQVAWSPDGKVVATGFGDGSVNILDATGKRLRSLRPLGNEMIDGLEFVDASTLFSWTYAGAFSLDRLDGSNLLRVGAPTGGGGNGLVVPKSKLFARLESPGVKLRELSRGQESRRIKMETGRPSNLAASLDGRYLAVSRGPHVVFFDTASGKRLGKLLKDSVFDVDRLKFTPRGTLLTLDRISVREWSVPAGTAVRELTRMHLHVPYWLVVSGDGRSLAVGGMVDGEPKTFYWPDPASETRPLEFAGRPLAVLNDGGFVTSTKSWTEVKVQIRTRSGDVQREQTFPVPKDDPNADLRNPVLSPDGSQIAVPFLGEVHIIPVSP